MGFRFRIGPFTFGKSGTRFSWWSGETVASIPLTNKEKEKSFGKVNVDFGSYHWNEKSKNGSGSKKKELDSDYVQKVRQTHKQAIPPPVRSHHYVRYKIQIPKLK